MSLYEDLKDDANVPNSLMDLGAINLRDHFCRVLDFYAQVVVSAAEMDALNATPKELIPAPGTGKLLVLSGVYCHNQFNTTAFAMGDGTLDVKYENSSGALAAQFTNAFVESATDVHAFAGPVSHALVPSNKAIVLHASEDVTAGDGVLELRVFYKIVRHSEF